MRNDDHPGHAALRRGRFSHSGQIYHITTTTRDRLPVFAEFYVACAAARCFDNLWLLGDARLLAWVLMPDHVHWLIELGQQDIELLVSRLKSASARAANRELQREGAFWAKAFHDHALRQDEDIPAVARYIVANPVRAGLVPRVGDYPFWNAVWL